MLPEFPAAPPGPEATVLLVALVVLLALAVAALVSDLLPLAELVFDALAFWFAVDEFEAVPARLLLDVLEAVAFVDAEAFALFDAVAFVDMFDAEVFEAFAELERLAF